MKLNGGNEKPRSGDRGGASVKMGDKSPPLARWFEAF